MSNATKRWTRHATLLAEGDWHVHSRWSHDAEGTIPEYCRQARANGLRLIAFTEHVGRNVPLDYDAFSEDVDQARERFPDLVILKGCEASVVSTKGDIDAPAHVLERCDVVVGLFQSFPDPSDYLTSLENFLANPNVDIWGQPTLYAVRHGMPVDLAAVEKIIDLCTDRQVLIEFNRKYRLPSDAMRALVVERGAKYVFGSDAHQVEALRSRKDDI